MKARALGREKVWQASSSRSRYASVSTILPAHFPQISCAPTSSRAQVIGSRRKKSCRMIRFLTDSAFAAPTIRLERLPVVINGDLYVARDRFPVPKRRKDRK